MTLITAREGAAWLEALVDGLLFVSESDAALRVVVIDALSELNSELVEEPLSALFDRTVIEQPWHGPAERAVVMRYRALVDFLTSALDDARVFRDGEITVRVHALGKTSDGKWLGVATTLVQT